MTNYSGRFLLKMVYKTKQILHIVRFNNYIIILYMLFSGIPRVGDSFDVYETKMRGSICNKNPDIQCDIGIFRTTDKIMGMSVFDFKETIDHFFSKCSSMKIYHLYINIFSLIVSSFFFRICLKFSCLTKGTFY